MTRTTIESWQDLRLAELFYAYRKAKSDCFFERSLFLARDFVSYESELPENLNTLLTRLQAGEIEQVLHENIGEPVLVQKH